MTRYLVPAYKPLKEISKRAMSWITKRIPLSGVWFDTHESGMVCLRAKSKGGEVEAVLTLAEARALHSLLQYEIIKAQGRIK